MADFFLAHQRNPYVTELVPEAPGRIDGPRARKLFLERFATLSPYARRKAGEVLAQKLGEELQTAMFSHLAANDRHLRQAAVEMLGHGRDPLATSALGKHLKDPAGEALISP